MARPRQQKLPAPLPTFRHDRLAEFLRVCPRTHAALISLDTLQEAYIKWLAAHNYGARIPNRATLLTLLRQRYELTVAPAWQYDGQLAVYDIMLPKEN